MIGSPMVLRWNGASVLVVGGGPVGRRKAIALAEAGAAVKLISVTEKPEGWRPEIEWHARPVKAADLRGVRLIVAAATPRVNRKIVTAARRRGIWVCRTDRAEGGDCDFLAVHRRGALMIGVGTGGASPALAAYTRDRIAADLDRHIAGWADLIAEFRPHVRRLPDAGVRRSFLRSMADAHWLDRIREVGVTAVRREWHEWFAKEGASPTR